MNKRSLSIVIPVKNEQTNIPILYEKILKAIDKASYEIIYINDGSTDETLKAIHGLQKKDPHVHYVDFRKNQGKAAALMAGFGLAKNDVVVTMDGDLQDDPSDLPNLLKKIDEGYDAVIGWKEKKYKKYNPKFLPSRIFNFLARSISGLSLHDFDCPFKAFKKEVVKDIRIYGELHRYIPILLHQEGYKITEVKVKNLPRLHGTSNFGSKRLLKGFLDLITVFFLTRFAKRPLHFFGTIGLVLLSLGTLLGMYLLYLRIFMHVLITKEAFILLALLLIILGVQSISIGLIGEMLVHMGQKKE